MKKYVLILAVVVVLFLTYSNYNLRNRPVLESNISEIVRNNTDYELSVHKYFNKSSQNYALRDHIYDYKLNQYSLEDSKLVLRIPSNVCNPCYDEIYGLIRNNFDT